MLRLSLLFIGVLCLIAQLFFQTISANAQFLLFIIGIGLLGIPHGAADLLVAIKNAETAKHHFSNSTFFATYLTRIVVFGLVLYFFPVLGIFLFLLFSAYHFGETDLYFLNTKKIFEKILVSSYGFVLLSVILLSNMEELQVLIHQSELSTGQLSLLVWVNKYHGLILTVFLLFFFISVFLYFLQNKGADKVSDSFLLQFSVLVFILYNMPLVLGFTFYFVVWHSVLSLKNIITYLQAGNKYSFSRILKQISFYSILAIGGIIITGVVGYIFINSKAVILYVFLGLAVLTAPHMEVMHDMYNRIRSIK
jgi:beta-carotene 15,15'-dioxygenase